MIKQIGYRIFALFYTLFRLAKRNPQKVFLVATHDDSPEGNIGIVAEELKKQDENYEIIWFTRKNRITRPIDFFIKKAYHLATSGTIFLDNGFLPMAYFRFAPDVKVVQLWHGTGTIKKFGQDSNEGKLKILEYKANRNITHLIVNSDSVKEEYVSAFGVPDDKAYVLGLPRTDRLLDSDFMDQCKSTFYQDYPDLEKKKCILYAPTFRDHEVENPRIHLDLDSMSQALKEDEVLLIRLHPHVAGRVEEELKQGKWHNIINVSNYSGVTTLLSVADMLITDYSSIIFEYCLTNRPMIFYAYDLEVFEKDGRSFYRDYREYVPGKVVETQEELVRSMERPETEKISGFVEENFKYKDLQATKRLFQLIFQK